MIIATSPAKMSDSPAMRSSDVVFFVSCGVCCSGSCQRRSDPCPWTGGVCMTGGFS